MSSEPYLICHLVRGEPAFDIAERIQIGDEEGWIVPTSGHRAYPYWHVPVKCLAMPPEWPLKREFDEQLQGPGPAPEGWPDHYTTTAAPGRGLIHNLGSILGLIPKPSTIRRR